MRSILLACLLVCSVPILAQTAPSNIPKPAFQGDFFGEMPRVFCTLEKIDPRARTVTVKLDKDGSTRQVAIGPDTEIHFRDSWGELTDYFPGEHVMLFMYVDDDHNWTHPRAIQDDIHMTARHNWFAKVVSIDTQNRTYRTSRQEKDAQGKVKSTIDKEWSYTPDVKVWKGESPSGADGLHIDDEVIQQLVEKEGKLTAVEIFDRKGDDAVRAIQDARHTQDQDRLGLPAYVTDLEPLSGLLVVSVAWSGSDRAKALKPGDVVAVAPTDGGKTFAAAVSSLEGIDSRQRVQCVVNSRIAAKLAYGQSLRLFMPGTGPAIPTGRAGVPTPAH